MTGHDDFVDGGAALVAKPYDDVEWRAVRKAWWWHTIGMLCFSPWYGVVALTVWQQKSRQSLGRRVTWAVMMTIGAMLLVGLPAMLVFSRRWYWIHRHDASPEEHDVGIVQPDASAGYLAWIAVGGCSLADRVTRRTATRVVEPTSLGEPWASLLGDATHAVKRIERSVAECTGPAARPTIDALREATASVDAARRVALQATDVEVTIAGLGADRVQQRLDALPTSPASDDIEATRRSLTEQLATADRMMAYLAKLEGQLQRLVAQLGEAAARADELAVCPPDQLELPTGMTDAVDRLAAIRSALEAVERPPA